MLITTFHASDEKLLLLYGIYKETIKPDLSYKEFWAMYFSASLVAIDFSFFTRQEERAGFSVAFFYTSQLQDRKVFIARTATGLVEKFQGKGCHNLHDLYSKFMRFALTHPFRQLFVTAYVINPFVYKELHQFVPSFYPKPHQTVPDGVADMMRELIVRGGHDVSVENWYVVKVPIQVHFNAGLMKRFRRCKDESVRWFLDTVDFTNKHGLLVVVNVSLPNIAGTFLRLGRWYLRKI